jgi:WD40 repeat protein
VAFGDDNGNVYIYNSSSPSSSLSRINAYYAHHWGISIPRIRQSPFNSSYVATCGDLTVKIWSVASSSLSDWTLVQTFHHLKSHISDCEWMDGDTLASSGESDGTILIWSVSSGETMRTINYVSSVYVICLKSLDSSSSRRHLAAGHDKDINIYDIIDGSLFATLKGHENKVRDLAQLNTDILASASEDNTVRIWNLTTHALIFTLTGHTAFVHGLKQITANILASGSDDSTIKLWDISSGQEIRTLMGHTHWIFKSLDLMDHGQTLVSGSMDGTVRKWNWSNGEELSSTNVATTITSLAVIEI